MDVHLGIPNEHLGKSATDYDVKSPMYSTAIGLVLAGFTSSQTKEEKVQLETPIAGNRVGKILEKSKSNKFFENLILKTKGLLIDDNINGIDY